MMNGVMIMLRVKMRVLVTVMITMKYPGKSNFQLSPNIIISVYISAHLSIQTKEAKDILVIAKTIAR